MVHDERHHAGGAVLRGEGHEAEAADHVTTGHVVGRPVRRIRTLAREDPVVVAMIGRLSSSSAVSLGPGLRHERSERARLLARLGVPVEAVPLARRAPQSLRVFADFALLALPGIVFALGIDVGEAHLDGVELVPADAAVEDLFAARRGVEAPARAVGHHGNGEGEIVRAHVEHDLSAPRFEPVRRVVCAQEGPARPLVFHRVARGDEGTTGWSQRVDHHLGVAFADRVDEALHRFVRSLEQLLLARRGRPCRRAAHERHEGGEEHDRPARAAHRLPRPPPPPLVAAPPPAAPPLLWPPPALTPPPAGALRWPPAFWKLPPRPAVDAPKLSRLARPRALSMLAFRPWPTPSKAPGALACPWPAPPNCCACPRPAPPGCCGCARPAAAPWPPRPAPSVPCCMPPRAISWRPSAARPRKASRDCTLGAPALLKRCCVEASRYCAPLRCSGLCCQLPEPRLFWISVRRLAIFVLFTLCV